MDEQSIVELAEGAEEIGLALILQDLITQNLEQSPHKLTDLNKMKVNVGLIVTDAELELTMEFLNGKLVLHPGIKDNVNVLITGETDIVMAMSNLQIKNNMPHYFDETGREVLKAIFSKKMKIKGMLTNFPNMLRLTRVLSVN